MKKLLLSVTLFSQISYTAYTQADPRDHYMAIVTNESSSEQKIAQALEAIDLINEIRTLPKSTSNSKDILDINYAVIQNTTETVDNVKHALHMVKLIRKRRAEQQAKKAAKAPVTVSSAACDNLTQEERDLIQALQESEISYQKETIKRDDQKTQNKKNIYCTTQIIGNRVYIEPLKQERADCGYHTIKNLILFKRFSQGDFSQFTQQITDRPAYETFYAQTRELIAQFRRQLNRTNLYEETLEADELYYLAAGYGLQADEFTAIDTITQFSPHAIWNEEHKQALFASLKKIQQNRNCIHFFALNTGAQVERNNKIQTGLGHWIGVVLVKNEGAIQFYAMNSSQPSDVTETYLPREKDGLLYDRYEKYITGLEKILNLDIDLLAFNDKYENSLETIKNIATNPNWRDEIGKDNHGKSIYRTVTAQERKQIAQTRLQAFLNALTNRNEQDIFTKYHAITMYNAIA